MAACACLVVGVLLSAPCFEGLAGRSRADEPHPGSSHTFPSDQPRPAEEDRSPVPLIYRVKSTESDGTEVNGVWLAGGHVDGLNYVGTAGGDTIFSCGLRFWVDRISEGDSIAFARLRLASQGGKITSGLDLRITAVAEDHPAAFSQQRRPSVLRRRKTSVDWRIRSSWRPSGSRPPIYYSSPDLAPIINEVISRPPCGEPAMARYLCIIIECSAGGSADGFVRFEDIAYDEGRSNPAVLEVYRTVWDALVGKPMLGRPTNRSVTVSCLSLVEIDAYVEYGNSPGAYSASTPPVLRQASMEPIEIVIDGLRPDREYYYRLRYRAAGRGEYRAGHEASFHTQRLEGSPFSFTIQADCHLSSCLEQPSQRRCESYEQTLLNVFADQPDFHIDLGDFAMTESIGGRNAAGPCETLERYLWPRKLLASISHSIPFYLVLGNHEGEQGWRALNPRDSLEVWSTRARKIAIPNPYPDRFYSGNVDTTLCCGLREDYYAWHWGNALFVVLDPYWYTPYGMAAERRDSREYISHGRRTAWEWTLGEDQYKWFYRVLHESDAEWKFVFSHQLVGGLLMTRREYPYGRGGADAAKFKVAGHASYEWGGEDAEGNYVFQEMRPGWGHGPIHDIMVKEGVDVFFHGHDHAFVHEVLDGIVYQACPVPRAGGSVTTGFYKRRRYSTGVVRPNWGHLRVSVWPDSVRVDYVRSVLPADEPLLEAGDQVTNASISYSYTLTP